MGFPICCCRDVGVPGGGGGLRHSDAQKVQTTAQRGAVPRGFLHHVLLAVTPDGVNCVYYTAGLLTRGSLRSSPFPAPLRQWYRKVARRSQSRGRLRLRCRDLVHRPHSRFSSNAFAPLSTVMTVSVRLGGSRSSTKPACLSSAAPN